MHYQHRMLVNILSFRKLKIINFMLPTTTTWLFAHTSSYKVEN